MQARIQEKEAFSRAVTSETRRLYGLALSILRDEGEAEDAVQETLVKAWRSWGELSTHEQVAPWLIRVCVNHCISRRRYLISRKWPHLGLRGDVPSRRESRSSGELVDLDRAYRELSVRQRAAITLTYRHGYSIDECARLMGCRPGTVRSHIARALTTLRKELDDE